MDQQVIDLLANISDKLDSIHEILLDFDAAFLEECEEDGDGDDDGGESQDQPEAPADAAA